jgi:hypothetical protein
MKEIVSGLKRHDFDKVSKLQAQTTISDIGGFSQFVPPKRAKATFKPGRN